MKTFTTAVCAVVALTVVARAEVCEVSETAAHAESTDDATRSRPDDAFIASAMPKYRARSLECVACQRAMAYFDEHLMLALQDIAAAEAKRAKKSQFATNYGRLESVIEEAVPSACRIGSIATNRTLRTTCERMIERSEDAVVALYFKAGDRMRRGEGEEPMGEALCGSEGAMMAGACDEQVAKWSVAELEVLEMESMKVSKMDFDMREQPPGLPKTYKSEAEEKPPKKGRVAKIVASDFYKRVILDREIDALMYYSYPVRAPEFHAAYSKTHALLAELLEDSEKLLIGELNVEKNEVPSPYDDMATTPAILMYKANKKENPRWIPLRTQPGEDMTGESAPTLADVLTMVSKHAVSSKTKLEADRALVEASAEQLHDHRGRKTDEL